MNLSNLRPAEGSRKKRKRRGRGPGSGLGKTSGRGHKGQLSGSGYSRKRDFEGGQMPLARRVPKRGFTNIFRTEYVALNLDTLAKMKKEEISFDDLLEAGLVRRKTDLVKILGRGELKSALTVHAHRFSRSAQKKIEEKGGKTVTIGKD